MKEDVRFRCLSPEGLLATPEPIVAVSPRLGDIAERKIRLFWDGKAGGDNLCVALRDALAERYPTASVEWVPLGDMDAVAKARAELDAFIYAVGDSGMGGWNASLNGARMELELNRPGVLIVADNAIRTARTAAGVAGMPDLHIVSLPSIEYFPNRMTVEGLRALARATVGEVVRGLTVPSSSKGIGSAERERTEGGAETVVVTATSCESGLEKYNRICEDKGWGDGLPLVPATEEAVEWMLTGTRRSPDDVLGRLPYRGGIITVRKVAINAVMAGAKPEYLPVIIAAMECLGEGEGFHHAMSSEGSFTFAIVVSGRRGKKLGMNCGVGLLGHGYRANSTIGRAVRLCLNNIGYVRPGEIDMALIGRPSSHTFYTFCENEDQSPWEAYHVSQGFGENEDCVTVTTVGGMTGFGMKVYGGGVVEPWDVESVLDQIVKDVAADREVLGQYRLGAGNPAAHFRKHIVIVHPELAILLHRRGYSRWSLVDFLFESAKVPYEELSEGEIAAIRERIGTKPGGLFFKNDAIPQNRLEEVKAALNPGGRMPVAFKEDLHVIVSGSIPGYSFGLTYFRSAHDTRHIESVP